MSIKSVFKELSEHEVASTRKVNLEINGIPPSLNSMYRVFNGRVILSRKIREYKDIVLRKHLREVNDFFCVKSDFYEIEIEFETPEFFRRSDGLISLTSGDLDNMCKAVILR